MRLIKVLLAAVVVVTGLGSVAASASPQGPWLPAVDLSAAGQNSDQPQVAFGDDGTAIAVWVRNDGTSNIVQAAIRPPGGAFGAGVDLSQAGENAGSPQVAFAPNGTATVIWSRLNGTHYIVQAATRPPGGAFGNPVDLSATGQSALNAQIAVAADGTATVVWWRSDGTNRIIQAATRPPGGAFGDPVALSAAGQTAYSP
ncbi:MAG: hypothetical protein J0H66_13965 [Solirubrobacterales bacterium]|nr:hypothetical protein [Solirubrobacterales bacterium]OJU94512.1 MAG: hypothetical protein BGO23_03675 [Solirubrobacterales bacterium 67-14]